jgi:excisionase family DNA binding protein
MTAPKADAAPAEPISVRIPEAVRLTGLSRSRIYELMRSGDIHFAKVGSSTLILVESLRSFVESRRSPAAERAGEGAVA